MSNWIISIFSVFGAWGLCGLGGAIIAQWFPSSQFSIEGFFAAFGVVSIAYLSAPNYKKLYSVIWFIVGAVAAYILLYPVNSRTDSVIPLVSTISGGLVVLVIILMPQLRITNNKE
jgi:hypothetical protein